MWEKAEEFLAKDRYIGPLIKKWGRCKIKPIKKSLYFEDLVYAICSQQLSGKAAETIFGRVKNSVGKVIPQNILSKKDEELRACGLSRGKVSYVKDLALHVKEKKLNLFNLDNLSDEQVVGELVAVKGVGRWTAEMFLMFSLARPDIFPIDDLGIRKAMERLKLKSGDRWKPYRTVACWYLWKLLDNR